MSTKPKLWTGTFIALTGANFLSALGFYLLIVILAEYSMNTFDVSYSAAGSTMTAYVISAMLTRLFLGGRIDIWGIKRSMWIGFSINAFATCLYILNLGFGFLLAVRVLHGVGFALASGSAASGAAIIIPAQRRGEGIGYFSMAQALATGIGPFVAIWLVGLGGYRILFIFTAVMSLLAIAAVAPLNIPRTWPQGAPKPKFSVKISNLVQMAVVPLACCVLLNYVCYAGIVSFMTLFAAERNLTDAAGLYFVVYAIVILVSRPPVGRRVDRKGENSVAYFSIAALVVGMVALAFAYNAPVLLVSAAFCGFGIGVTQSVVQAAIVRMTPPEELGRANSTFFMTMDLGSGVGPVAIGALIPFIGYQSTFLVLAALAACSLVLYHLVHGRKQAH